MSRVSGDLTCHLSNVRCEIRPSILRLYGLVRKTSGLEHRLPICEVITRGRPILGVIGWFPAVTRIGGSADIPRLDDVAPTLRPEVMGRPSRRSPLIFVSTKKMFIPLRKTDVSGLPLMMIHSSYS